MKLDPVLLEILQTQMQAVTEEMAITLARTARSTYVKDAADFATALANLGGKFFCYPARMGVSGFLDLDCGVAIRAIPDLEPGDVIITNHPYLSGGLSTHMPDLQLIKPYYHEGQIVCYGWDFIHSADIGGGVPSSISPRFTELFQEGLQIPPMKLVKAGQLNRDFETIYRANCRLPDLNMGDIKAMLAALTVGERRVADLIARHGLETFQTAQVATVDLAREKALVVQRRIPDGTYVFWDYMDDDYATSIPIRIRCEMSVNDGQVHLDFTGSDPQVIAAYNVPTGGLRHPWLTLKLMHLIGSYDRTVPLNFGLFENISVHVPKGTVLNPEFPAAVGVRHATAIRINDAVVGTIATALPGLIPAPSGGTVVPTVIAEQNPVTGSRSVVVIQSLVGGTGAREGGDGVDGRDSGLANLYNTPLERSEADTDVVIEVYGLRPDSGGAGRWRGGTGLEMRVFIARAGTAVLGRGLERFVFRPWGVSGGGPGAVCRVILNHGLPDERDLGKLDMYMAEEGDRLTILTAGGGGFGDPFTRDPAAVLRDVVAGFVSVDRAAQDYGVVVVDGAVDEDATAALRSCRAVQPDFNFGPEREAWERVFDDATLCALSARLLKLPATIRAQTRKRIIEASVPGLNDVAKIGLPDLMADPAAIRARLDEAMRSLPS
ncbi:MAG: hydantoinase B/oxoprolinase family protein [Proteobacteria bacterium]|nr:hydantoinase B/oxoprolinase family protein [Pseudomonadota bacterium]